MRDHLVRCAGLLSFAVFGALLDGIGAALFGGILRG
jgi:hypothetical protein